MRFARRSTEQRVLTGNDFYKLVVKAEKSFPSRAQLEPLAETVLRTGRIYMDSSPQTREEIKEAAIRLMVEHIQKHAAAGVNYPEIATFASDHTMRALGFGATAVVCLAGAAALVALHQLPFVSFPLAFGVISATFAAREAIYWLTVKRFFSDAARQIEAWPKRALRAAQRFIDDGIESIELDRHLLERLGIGLPE